MTIMGSKKLLNLNLVKVKAIWGEFGEVTVIIGLVINVLAFISPLLTLFCDTSSYALILKRYFCAGDNLYTKSNEKIFFTLPSSEARFVGVMKRDINVICSQFCPSQVPQLRFPNKRVGEPD